jgi:drug/metabolite transporter (DMT)-like permease
MDSKPRFSSAQLAWAFVLIWGMGFVASKTGLQFVPPLTFLTLRFTLGIVCMALIVLWLRPRWPSTAKLWMHVMIAGALVHPIHLGGSHYGQALGLSAGAVALIMATQPLITALLAPALGERITARQVLGVLIGFAGVALLVWHKLDTRSATAAAAMSVGIGALSLTIGTLYQRHFCKGVDVWANATIQFSVALALLFPTALWIDGPLVLQVSWKWPLVLSLLYLVLLGSITAVNILNELMRRTMETKAETTASADVSNTKVSGVNTTSHPMSNGATRVASMIYYTPIVALVGELLLYRVVPGWMAITGIAVTCFGVVLVVKTSERTDAKKTIPKKN